MTEDSNQNALWPGLEPVEAETRSPLADRMRPRTLDEFVGQEHLLSAGKPLRLLIASGQAPSMIFWGPPGSGKTTLSGIIAEAMGFHLMMFSAVLTGIKEVRAAMSDAAYIFDNTGRRTMVFIDEIHRFNRAQQDAFLPFVEKGRILLAGATTVNPSFDLNAALLSRVKVFTLIPLETGHIETILDRALNDVERGLGNKKLSISTALIHRIALFASGDARKALNVLEQLAQYVAEKDGAPSPPDETDLAEVMQRKVLLYDKDGEEHYNMLSALHKSMRNSDPDATTYWVVRMLEGGEDPRNICRRIIQCASEDIGLADSQALHLAVHAWQAYEMLGLPEARLSILQAAIYNAVAPKSNSLLGAYLEAQRDVQENATEPVPLHLRNAPTGLMKAEGYGEGYLYAHDYPEGTTDMTGLPPALNGRVYYRPKAAGLEVKIAEKLAEIAQRKEHFTQRAGKRKKNEGND